MTVILGITDGDDAGATLLVDGRVVAAVNEERLNRLKLSIGFPRRSVQEVLRLGGVSPREVDRVAMAAYVDSFSAESRANKGWFQDASTVVRLRNGISSALALPLGGSVLARKAHQHVKRLTMGRRRAGVRRLLAELRLRAPLSYHEHHRSHAIAAFDASGFDKALSVSLDGGGDGSSSHVYAIDQRQARLVNRLDSFDSIGNYYAYVTHLCGFRASIHEGKITGLAARGQPIYRDIFERLIIFDNGEICNVGRLFHRKAIAALRGFLPPDWEHEDLAASIQRHLEDVAVRYVRFWLQRSGLRKLCLSGGVFANVRLNQCLAELPECDALYVFPAMGDGGLATGAAYSAWRSIDGFQGPLAHGSSMDHAYLGSAFTVEEIERAVVQTDLPLARYPDIEDVVATLIHQGRVVARFDGAMEYGPRALGNRSILYRADDSTVNDWLNRRLHRTEFMPFAPACLAGQEDLLFEWRPAFARATRFMTITLACSAWMKQNCPAVVHVDGTARPQLVDPQTNPGFHRIIARYHELSGIPVVVNTSFNMHEEPIVCTPDDAVRAFRRGRLDNLAIGPFLLGALPMEGA